MANFKKHKRENHVTGDTILRPGRRPDGNITIEAAYEIISTSDYDPELRIKCHICGMNCYGNYDVNKHYRRLHSDKSSKVYNCIECSASFKSRPSFDRHCAKYHYGVTHAELCNTNVTTVTATKCSEDEYESSADLGATTALLELEELGNETDHMEFIDEIQ